MKDEEDGRMAREVNKDMFDGCVELPRVLIFSPNIE